MKNKILGATLFFICLPLSAFEIDLTTAQRMALESSEEISAATNEINTGRMRRKALLSSFLPQLGFNCSKSRQTNYFSPDSDSYQLGMSLTQIVFDGGRTAAKIRLSDVTLGIQSDYVQIMIENLKNEVWQFYYTHLLLKRQLDLKNDLLAAAESQLRVAFEKYNLGKITELEYLEAAAEVQKLKLGILEIETNMQTNMNRLAVLIGLEGICSSNKQELKLSGNIDKNYNGLDLHDSYSNSFEESALSNNYELSRKKAELIKKEAEYRLKKYSFLPLISIEASFYWQGESLPLTETGGSLNLKLNLPIAAAPVETGTAASIREDSGHSASVDSSVSILPDPFFIPDLIDSGNGVFLQASELDVFKTELVNNVKLSLKTIDQLGMLLDLNRNIHALSERRLRITEQKYTAGSIRGIELMKERTKCCEAEISIYRTIFDLMKAEKEFETLTGLSCDELKNIACRGDNNED